MQIDLGSSLVRQQENQQAYFFLMGVSLVLDRLMTSNTLVSFHIKVVTVHIMTSILNKEWLGEVLQSALESKHGGTIILNELDFTTSDLTDGFLGLL